MIATHPPYKPRAPIGIVKMSMAIALLLSPFFVKLHLEQRQRNSIAVEYRSSRSTIFSKIDSAVEDQDLDALIRINDKYTRCVSDGTFRAAIRDAIAKVSAREAELELAVSRHLDLLRHQEESTVRFDPLERVTERPAEQQLSELPK